MKLHLIFILAAFVFIQGCATGPKRTLLNQTSRAQVQTVHLYNYVLNDEVIPAVELSNVTGAMGGGLIPALIDSSINSKRTAAAASKITEFYSATDQLDYRKILAKEINAGITPAFRLAAAKDKAETVFLNDKALSAKANVLPQGEYFMSIQSSYGFKEDSKTLTVDMAAFIFNKDPAKSSGKPKPIYYNVFHYVSAPTGQGGENSLSTWMDKNGAQYAQTLTESAQELAAMLKYDLQNNAVMECGNETKASVFAVNALRINMTATELAAAKGSRTQVRGNDGALYSLPVSAVTATGEKNQKNCTN
ncbi:MAG: hypothetical protein RL497_1697 [Pseudomonadota bacterium]|jgi:hypothetical protein